ncbi:MAG: 2-iminoacetate synthase ThiH [Deltaproteobacteria bacterium]|nr:2-iminoacetate synthase ThiH [Deltaproteobacteria bacterium]MBN2672175.1 2-iminoacetate synthase ThiH [Deltaproteobacteria bacterium]
MTPLFEQLQMLESASTSSLLQNTSPAAVSAVIGKTRLQIDDLALLLSPGSDELLEEMAQRANGITQARFGNAVSLYAPLYISNKCSGTCPYCGFKRTEKIKRKTLSLEEVISEGDALSRSGIQHVLLVTGDCPGNGVDFLCDAARQLKKTFPSVTVEIPPLEQSEYAQLIEAGVDGVTLYQETYNKEVYDFLHKGSPKDNYMYRLDALSRAGAAGIRKLNVGVLWGLSDWRGDALKLALHARFLEKTCWRSQVLIGMPRLHKVPGDFTIPHPVCNRDFAHIVMAMRLFLHDAGIVVSTRERPEFRDNLLAIGATQFSAGSKTEPGGYSVQEDTSSAGGAQFEIDDHRSPKTVEQDLSKLGYDPVFKDWDRGFIS